MTADKSAGKSHSVAKPRKSAINYHKVGMTCYHQALFESFPPALGDLIWCTKCGAYRIVSS